MLDQVRKPAAACRQPGLGWPLTRSALVGRGLSRRHSVGGSPKERMLLKERAHAVDLGGLGGDDLLGHLLDEHVGALGEFLVGHGQGALVVRDH